MAHKCRLVLPGTSETVRELASNSRVYAQPSEESGARQSAFGADMARFRNVCFTLNNPEGLIEFDENEMQYLVYQEEIAASGTYHFQGYCEFLTQVRSNRVKELLGGRTVHIAARRGTQVQAVAYCKREFNEDGSDKRLPHTEVHEDGIPREQGLRVDLEEFKNAVLGGAKRRDLVDDHCMILAKYPKFYNTLTELHRPHREKEPVVTLLIGDTGLGKTRWVHDKFEGDPDFWIAPLTNGNIWFDTYDGHSIVLIDDFAGRASHFTLGALLQLLDRYTRLVPTKGGHTWWMPDEVYITTNLLPKLWYSWTDRGHQYKALARRIHKVFVYHVPLSAADCGYTEQDPVWWEDNAPPEADYPVPLRCPMTGVIVTQ